MYGSLCTYTCIVHYAPPLVTSCSTTPQVDKSCKLIGFFVEPKIWTRMSLDQLRLTSSPGAIRVLQQLMKGSGMHSAEHSRLLYEFAPMIIEALSEPMLLHSIEVYRDDRERPLPFPTSSPHR